MDGETTANAVTSIGANVSSLLSDVISPAMNFITSNDLCLIMLALSFTGAAFGFVRRIFKTARA